MSQPWFTLRDGRQGGPYSPDQLRQLVTSGELAPTDQVRRGDSPWVVASQVKGLLPVAKRVEDDEEPLPLEPVRDDKPLPLEAVRDERPASATTRTTGPAAAATRTTGPAAATRTTAPAGPKAPPLKERPGVARHSRTGDHDEFQFARLWNALEVAGPDPADLVLFCNTRTVEGNVATKAIGFLAGKISGKQAGPPAVIHLALYRHELVVLSAADEDRPRVARHPLDGLSWSLQRPADGVKGTMSGWLTGTTAEDRERTLVLTLASAAGKHSLQLHAGGGAEELRTRLGELVLAKAEALADAGQSARAEALLGLLPADGPHARRAKEWPGASPRSRPPRSNTARACPAWPTGPAACCGSIRPGWNC